MTHFTLLKVNQAARAMGVANVLVAGLDGPPLSPRVDEGPPPPRRHRAASRVATAPAVDHPEARPG
jgi:hypothetical protein